MYTVNVYTLSSSESNGALLTGSNSSSLSSANMGGLPPCCEKREGGGRGGTEEREWGSGRDKGIDDIHTSKRVREGHVYMTCMMYI